MEILTKIFSSNHLETCENIKQQCKDDFNLNPVNNICLILEKIKLLSTTEGCYVECGTFKGNTLIPTALYSLNTGFFKNKKIIGIDTFEGFPIKEHNKKDLPSYFNVLYENNLITDDHYNKAKKRTNNFQDLSHLENDLKKIFLLKFP